MLKFQKIFQDVNILMKKIAAFSLVMVMFLACASFAGEKGGMPGGTQGTYYGFGSVLAGMVGDKTSTTVTAISSGGAQANLHQTCTA